MQTLEPNTLPNYHFLFIAPELPVEWFFDAARAYFNRFRPTVVTDFGLMRNIPPEYTFALTAIVRRDAVAGLGVQLAQLRPNALYDPVVHDTAEEARQVLDGRAAASQPFGVPLINQSPNAEGLGTLPAPALPSAGSWVTVTPPPTTPTPYPTQLPPGDPIPTIQPTPGPLIGG